MRRVASLGFWDTLTGRELAARVGEYSEIYGEILLGLHRDFERLKREVQEYREKTSRAVRAAREAEDNVRRLHREMEQRAEVVLEAAKRIDVLTEAIQDAAVAKRALRIGYLAVVLAVAALLLCGVMMLSIGF